MYTYRARAEIINDYYKINLSAETKDIHNVLGRPRLIKKDDKNEQKETKEHKKVRHLNFSEMLFFAI